MQILEHVEQRSLARQRRDDVVNSKEHRALPFLALARRLSRAGEMEELREGRRDHLRIRETELAELRTKLRCGLGVVRFDPHPPEGRTGESGVAPLVHP